ncbi:MAG: DUF3782 domain-containing protein [Acidobacteria bacterium]|nr:DUF3782 domain-containing protein [Acidobacteriota bacterium]
MTDQELRDLVASVAKMQAETAAQMQAHDRRIAELREQSDRRQAELDRQQAETNKQIKRVDKQIGDLGNKFGSFAEGMALPSMETVLRRRFGVNDVSPRRKFFLNGETLEMDVFGYDNTGTLKEAYVVEIKSHLKPEAIEQILETIAKLPRFFPAMKDRKIYGIIAAVDIPANLRAEVWKAGLYLARINDETFKLQIPRNFQPQAFGPAVEKNGHKNGHKTGKSKKKK